MIRRFLVIALSFCSISAAADAQQHEHAPKADSAKTQKTHSAEHMSGWKELDAYHMVMMQVWHPAKEKGDLGPIKAQALKLADAGDVWAKAAIPTACNTGDNRAEVSRIQADSRALASLVKDRSDAEIMEALKALHDRFEVVNRSCKVGGHAH